MERDPTYLPEIWGIYGAGLVIIFTRLGIRLKSVGLRGFEGDDLFSVIILPFWTLGAWVTHAIYFSGTNVEGNEIAGDLTAAQMKSFEYGSKLELVAWYSYTAIIFILKGSLLFFLYRLTIGLWQNQFIKWLAGACAISYVVVLLTLTLGCLPFSNNWKVRPYPGSRCSFRPQNFIVTVVFNVLTDAAILCIPIPLLWKLRVPLQRKMVISVMLCSGVFVICAAIIRVTITLGANPSTLTINRWGFREIIVGVFTVNVPILRPIVSINFWRSGHVSSPEATYGATGGANVTDVPGHGYQMASSVKESEVNNDDTGSEDFIIATRGVKVETTFEVRSDVGQSQTIAKNEYPGYRSTNKAEVDSGGSRI